MAWLEAQGVSEISKVTKDLVQDYQAHLYETVNSREEPNSVFHQNNALKAIKNLFHFLDESKYLASNPARDVRYARTPKRLPRSILTGQEAKKIIHAPNTDTATGYRDRTMMEVFYSTGMRRSELINLLVSDVDYHEGLVRINNGKGNKDRVVPIGRIACRYVENYIKGVRPLFLKNPAESHLFLTINGTKISKNRVWQLVKIYSRKTKIDKNITTHTLGILAPLSCSGTRRTSGIFRSSWATPRSKRARSMHPSPSRISRPCTADVIRGRRTGTEKEL